MAAKAFVGSIVHSLEGSHSLDIKDNHVLVVQNGKVNAKNFIKNKSWQ